YLSSPSRRKQKNKVELTMERPRFFYHRDGSRLALRIATSVLFFAAVVTSAATLLPKRAASADSCVSAQYYQGILGVTFEFANYCGRNVVVAICLREHGRY